MADIYEKVHHGKHYLIGVALSNLADVEQRSGHNAQSQELFRKVLAVYKEALPEDHPLQGIGRVRFGHALMAAGQAGEAATQSRTISAPCCWIIFSVEKTLPIDLDIFRPSPSTTKPWVRHER